MRIHWAKFWRRPQTYFLLAGTALGYALLIGLAGAIASFFRRGSHRYPDGWQLDRWISGRCLDR